MSASKPLITVGMFVRNGDRHIAAAIESFLHQTCSDFQLIVHDNASTDRTAAIVEEFARRDARVRLINKPHNLGAVRNCIEAADMADTPLFCWAASDDLREPAFLERLVALLHAQPEASLACCAVRNMDPDGVPREIRPETECLSKMAGTNAFQRLRIYLRQMPATPFYALFRIGALRNSLDVLRVMDPGTADRPAQLGLDMILLARFVREHDVAYVHEPLVLFRRGGVSHNLGRYGSLREYARQVRTFATQLRQATAISQGARSERLRLHLAQFRSIARWLMSRDMRRMHSHYLAQAIPSLRRMRTRLRLHTDRSLRRLRLRVRDMPANCRIILFGAGKHTQRRIDELRRGIQPHARIIAVCDDRAPHCQPIAGLPILAPSQLRELGPDVMLVSSDTYEAALFRRAVSVAPANCQVWCLYDAALETSTGVPAVESTSAMNRESSSSVSAARAA
jgi:glycosyltransferase involved in cell wall biosynthesis